jgi:hypothetical protein
MNLLINEDAVSVRERLLKSAPSLPNRPVVRVERHNFGTHVPPFQA